MCGDELGERPDVSGLAAFAAMRNGREVGRIGFEHEAVGGHRGEAVAKNFSLQSLSKKTKVLRSASLRGDL